MTKISTLLGVVAMLLPLKGLNSYTEYADISSYRICHAPEGGGCLNDPAVPVAVPDGNTVSETKTALAQKDGKQKHRHSAIASRKAKKAAKYRQLKQNALPQADFNAASMQTTSNEEEETYRATASRKMVKSAGASLDDALRYSMKMVPAADAYEPYAGYKPDIASGSYRSVLTDIKKHRRFLEQKLDNSRSEQEREAVLKDAADLFNEAFLNHIMPFWYGTPWDFYGHTENPGSGTIACGYLVSTTLNHLGINVNRYTLAQQWPVDIVRSLSAEEYYHYSSKNTAIDAIRKMGYGLYIVGLDNHVGFAKYDQWGVHFIHSNWAGSRTVVSEDPQYSTAFSTTRNYYIGKLSNNEHFITKWLHATNIKVSKG